MLKLLLSLLLMTPTCFTYAYENMQQPGSTNVRETAKAHFGIGESQEVFEGKVIEVIHTSSYSYLKVESLKDPGKQIWTAATKVPFGEGTWMKFTKTKPMLDFFSPTLKRKFAEIYFLSDFEVAKTQPGEGAAKHANAK